MKSIFSCLLALVLVAACTPPDPNINEAGEHTIPTDKQTVALLPELSFYDTVYVPIYSDIYSESKHTKFLLTATLSIRNTSLFDTIYITAIDYYDTDGHLVNPYIDQPLAMYPLQSIDYVIEEKDKRGGTGANFIVNWAAKNQQLKPIFQGIMISTFGQQGISFTTEGVSVSRR